jgi:hypothetical protein
MYAEYLEVGCLGYTVWTRINFIYLFELDPRHHVRMNFCCTTVVSDTLMVIISY